MGHLAIFTLVELSVALCAYKLARLGGNTKETLFKAPYLRLPVEKGCRGNAQIFERRSKSHQKGAR